jgi:hypothetical protein
MMSIRTLVVVTLTAISLVACGPSAGQIKTARSARYQTDASVAFQAAVAALKANDYKVVAADPINGRAVSDSRYYEVDGTHASRNSEGQPVITSAGAIILTVELQVKADGSTFYVDVLPHVQSVTANFSAPADLAPDSPAMPGWVSGKIDNLYLSIYDGLKKNAVAPGT